MDTRHGQLLVLTLAALVGCGGGSDSSGSSGGGGGGGGGASTSIDALNAYRSACGGTTLQVVVSNTALTTSATRHAGYQAIDDVSLAGQNLNHGEPNSSNALYTSTNLGDRIRSANGSSDISGANVYYEDVASTAETTAINQLWNSVYHRNPMMRHQSHSVGYGDMALARTQFPSAGVPAVDEWGNTPSGNGYATLEWAGYSTPAITFSYWPANGTTGVPPTFNSNSESPDPVSGRNQVGCPIHFIFADTAGTFTNVNVTLVTGSSTHTPMIALVGNATPSGAAGDVTSVTADTAYLDGGELYLIPTPAVVTSGLTPSTAYTLSGSVTLNGTVITLPNVTYTTAP